jgi:hypothetical protein
VARAREVIAEYEGQEVAGQRPAEARSLIE